MTTSLSAAPRFALRMLFTITVAVLLATTMPASAVTLVVDGEPTSVIVIAEDATAAARTGAAELQYHIEQMSGATLPIVTAGEATSIAEGTARILVGRSALTDALDVDLSDLPPEGFLVKTVGDALVLAGDDAGGEGKPAEATQDPQVRAGSAFAVYDFLQDDLGCQWIWPGPTGEHIPRRATIETSELDVVEGPALERRHMRLMMHRDFPHADRLYDRAIDNMSDQERQWYLRMRLGRHAEGPRGHSFSSHWETYKDTKPEIFALLPSGERGYVGSPRRVKMCVANPVLHDLLIEEFKAAREQNPNHRVMHLCEADGRAGHCTCERCQAWDVTKDNLSADVLEELPADLYADLEPQRDGSPAMLSTRYAKFINEMARRVREIDPDAYVTMYAMTRLRETPIGVTMEPNVMVNYVGFNNYPLTPAERTAERRDFTGWLTPETKVVLRPNAPHYAGDGMPYNIVHEMIDDFAFALDRGLVQAEYDAMLGYWASWGPTYYVLPRMMWEGKNVDPEKLIEEWFSAFGPAQRPMRSYYDFWEQHIRAFHNRPGVDDEALALGEGRGGPRAGRLLAFADIYTPEVLAEARSLLDEARAAAEGAADGVLEKIENIEMNQRNAELTAEVARLARAVWDDSSGETELASARESLLDHRRSIATRNAVNVYWMTQYEALQGDPFGWKTLPAYENE